MRPTQLRAGSKEEWTESFPYTSADGWTVKGRLLLVSGAPKDYTVVSSGTDHTFTIPSSLLSAVTPGKYNQVLFATKGSGETLQQIELANQWIDVLQNIASSTATLTKGYWRLRYEDLQATYATLSAQATTQASAHQRSVIYVEMQKVRSELLIAKRNMEAEENELAIASGTKVANKNVALISFVDP